MLSERRFRSVNFLTIIAVYFLILVGGIVRSTGSGMGCPDWPKCFGAVIPPISVDELPANYKAIFLEERLKKNERLSDMLRTMGLTGLSNRLERDPGIRVEEDFSPVKAWIEYVNRLIGVLIGLFITGVALTSLVYRKKQPAITVMAFLSLLLVIFIGWTGSIVVSTNLLPGMVTFHMSLALLLVALLIYMQHKVDKRTHVGDHHASLVTLGLFILLIPEVVLGTQVRELVDGLMASGVERANWIATLDWTYYVHRSYALILFALGSYLFWHFRRRGNGFLTKLSRAVVALMLLQAIGGAGMAYLAFPAFLQPLHLLGGAALFGLLFYLFLQTRSNTSLKP